MTRVVIAMSCSVSSGITAPSKCPPVKQLKKIYFFFLFNKSFLE